MQGQEEEKAKLDALAKENRGLEARVEQLEGNIHSLQGNVVVQDSKLSKI